MDSNIQYIETCTKNWKKTDFFVMLSSAGRSTDVPRDSVVSVTVSTDLLSFGDPTFVFEPFLTFCNTTSENRAADFNNQLND